MEKENKITPKDMICNILFNLSVNLSLFKDKIIIPKAWNIWYFTPVLKEESSDSESKSFNFWLFFSSELITSAAPISFK